MCISCSTVARWPPLAWIWKHCFLLGKPQDSVTKTVPFPNHPNLWLVGALRIEVYVHYNCSEAKLTVPSNTSCEVAPDRWPLITSSILMAWPLPCLRYTGSLLLTLCWGVYIQTVCLASYLYLHVHVTLSTCTCTCYTIYMYMYMSNDQPNVHMLMVYTR